MKRGRHIGAALFLLVWLVTVPVTALAEACRTDRLDLRGDWGQVRFAVELADSARERARGLMHRESMPTMSGMLFVYPYPQAVAFWMRNTLISLDMIFLDRTGTVTHIHPRAIPGDETPIPGGDRVKFVLEINGGLAKRLGIAVGSQMRHPSVRSNRAAWPCG